MLWRHIEAAFKSWFSLNFCYELYSEITLSIQFRTFVLQVLAGWKWSTRYLQTFSSIFVIHIIFGLILSFKGKNMHKSLQFSIKHRIKYSIFRSVRFFLSKYINCSNTTRYKFSRRHLITVIVLLCCVIRL